MPLANHRILPTSNPNSLRPDLFNILPPFTMKRSILLLLTILQFMAPTAAKAGLESDIRTEWSIDPAYQDRHINHVAFRQSLYGITWAHWLVVIVGVDDFANHILDGDYHLASLDVSEMASEAAIEEAVRLASDFPKLADWLLTAYRMSLNASLFMLELNALSIQHTRYFQARPYNSYSTILNLEPFDLLDGVNMTKEGNGWLFTTSGYLTPLPSGNYLQPAQFYALAEAAWQSVNIDPLVLSQEKQRVCALFTANLAVNLAQETVTVVPGSPTSASIVWDSAPDTTFFVEHSTNLIGWTRAGPHTSTGSSIQVVLADLPPANSRFFRIVVEP